MNQSTNPTTPVQESAGAAGAPSNSPGAMTPASPAAAMSGQPRGPVSPDPASNPADGAEPSLMQRIEALEAASRRLWAAQQRTGQAATVPVQRTVMRDGRRADETVQVPMRDFLIGLARRVGYQHRLRD